MNRFTLAFVAAIASATLLSPSAPLQAKDKDAASSLSIPVTGAATTGGGTFAGTFNLHRFVNNNGQVVAIGTIVGTVTDANGKSLGTGLQTVAIPVKSGPGTALAAAALAPAAISCPILHLDLGPLDLNLLGLTIHLDEVVLDITAVPGAGNLLGNLLCAVANLLNNPAGLTALLNQILTALLGGL